MSLSGNDAALGRIDDCAMVGLYAVLVMAVLTTSAAATEPNPKRAPRKLADPFNLTIKNTMAAEASSGQKLFRGKVVWLRKALARRKIEASEEVEKQAVLETAAGELIPLVPDWRGRAFFQDERLRNRDVELVGKRAKGVPYLQVLMVFTFDEMGNRQYTDYYCDTCGFPMYELKPCQCCQGPVRLRFQRRDLPDYIKAQLSNGRAVIRSGREAESKRLAPRP